MDITLFSTQLEACVADLNGKERVELARHCLDLFIGENFSGLLGQNAPSELASLGSLSELRASAFEALSFEFNAPFAGTRTIEQLFLCREILADKFLPADITQPLRFEWLFWRFRCYRFWSLILTEKSPELKLEIYKLIGELDNILESNENLVCWDVLFQYELEKSAIKAEFFEHAEAKKSLNKAAELADIDAQLSGALGRRTRFQTKSVAQLIVSIINGKDTENNSSEKENVEVGVPTNCLNADDTLLDRMQLDAGDADNRRLTEYESLYLLQSGLERFHASTELDLETSLAYLEKVIADRRNWAIQMRALIERSVLERKNKRRVERACSQMEVICKILDNVDESETEKSLEKSGRLRLIYSTSPVPFWGAQCIHAEILSSLGCVSEALRIYEFLGMWDRVVTCYRRLDQLEKAENIVRDLIAKEPNNPFYHCILGDITNKPECYEKAIEVSNDKCARAHSSLGILYLCRKEYAKAFKSLGRSVEIQPYQVGVWYNFGHCAMKLEKYQEAAKAYHRCVTFEPEHFEAWNNLAACYVNLDQKERAQKIVQESIKLKHDNWKVWENLVIISVSIDDFQTALLAIKNLMDAEGKRKIDDLPLEIILEKTLRLPLEETKNLRELLIETLARLLARQSFSAKLLKLYAELKRPPADSTDPVAWSKHIQLMEKALQKQCFEHTEKNEENFTKQLEITLELIDALRHEWKLKQMTEQQMKAQIRLRLRPLMSSIENAVGKECENSQNERLRSTFHRALSLL